RRHTRSKRDWSSDVCSSDLLADQGGKIKDALREAGEGITEFSNGADEGLRNLFDTFDEAGAVDVGKIAVLFKTLSDIPTDMDVRKIGRASCRERVWLSGGVGLVKRAS